MESNPTFINRFNGMIMNDELINYAMFYLGTSTYNGARTLAKRASRAAAAELCDYRYRRHVPSKQHQSDDDFWCGLADDMWSIMDWDRWGECSDLPNKVYRSLRRQKLIAAEIRRNSMPGPPYLILVGVQWRKRINSQNDDGHEEDSH